MVDEIRIHSGTQVKLRGLDEGEFPDRFLKELLDLAKGDRQVEAVYAFAIQPHGEEERIALVLALKGGLFTNTSEEFLRLVERIEGALPADLPVNVYRFGASQLIAGYCLQALHPLYLRSHDWIDKQHRRFPD